MTKPTQLTRVCTSCGIIKPLAAFLQLGGVHGTSYGAICSECRREVIKPKQPPTKPHKDDKDTEGQSSTSSGFRIGAKAKITAEREKQRQRQKITDLNQDEFKKRNEIRGEKLSQADIKQKLDKQHKAYLNTKNRGFLSNTAKKTPAVRPADSAQKNRGLEGLPIRDKNVVETEKREAQAEHELKLTTIDLTLPFTDPQFSEIRHQSSTFLRFKQWLGSGAPMAKATVMKSLEQIYRNAQLGIHHQKTEKKSHSKEVSNSLVDYIEKQFSPSSTRKR